MRRNILIAGLVLVFLFVGVPVARGAGFYIGLQGGLSNEGPSVKNGFGKIEFDQNSAFLYGAQVGLRILSFAVQGEFYRTGHSFLSDLVLVDGSGGVEVDYYYLGVNGKLGIPFIIVYPYITVGYGKYSTDIKGFYAGTKSGTDTSFNIGVGAELTLAKLGVFAEIRYIDFSMDIAQVNWDFGGINLHFGLNYHF